MGRPKIPIQTEIKLLLNCRRRCCICFGLDRDHRVKQGQIAHLDKNNQNNDIGNLAFLCFTHHDQYDSKTSQSKGLTLAEVKAFKEELEKYINENWNKRIVDNGKIKIDIFTGSYLRGDSFEGSKLEITFLGGNLIHVKGYSFWGKTRECGPNIGQLDFVTEVEINKAIFRDQLFDEEYILQLEFLGDKMFAKENYVIGYFGHNVQFEGEYHKDM